MGGSPNLLGASVRLLGKDDVFAGPIFESRNNVVGSDDSLAFAIVPFHLGIDKTDGTGHPLLAVRALDHLNPSDPQQAIWQIEDPTSYGRRLPSFFSANSAEVTEALGIFDFYGYFRDRRNYLGDLIARLEKERHAAIEPIDGVPAPAEVASTDIAQAVEEAVSSSCRAVGRGTNLA